MCCWHDKTDGSNLDNTTEGVHNANELAILVNYKHCVYLVLVQDVLYLGNLGFGTYTFGAWCHGIFQLHTKELLPQSLHGAAHVAIGKYAYHLLALYRNYQSQLAGTDVDNGFGKGCGW